MKKLIRKGFSKIELIFVMVVLAALAAMAISSIDTYNENEKRILAQMKYDLEINMNLLFKDYINKEDFSLVIPNTIVCGEASEYTNNIYIKEDLRLQLFNENKIDIKVVKNEGMCTNKIIENNFVNNGFEIKIYNKKIPNKAVKFNFCTDKKIELIDIK